MDLEIYQVDSFTSEPFKGNPAGVCISENPLTEELMFSIAEEMAVSETAFLTLNDMNLRWFTPKVEVKLCGHGTLAVAHVLKGKGLAQVGDILTFNTLSGSLSARICESTIELDFPSTELLLDLPINNILIQSLGLSDEQVVSFGGFDSKNIIEVVSDDIVFNLSPNFDALKKIEGRGVVVTAQSTDQNLDFVSRYFAPWVGVDEDPVTGSAHCALTQYWGQKLKKYRFNAYQASSRGGYICTELLPNKRIKLIGSARTVISGVLWV
ncbi:PhzF family phenazine biosynthesis protein [Photobacterium makurazakiensis]|uniref:PhzF family phenazine biosynthesis protein n=1 Tax=Photobacterium makurazakiensis TaxID=2910234 RepID=UPI003D0D2183